MVPAGVKPCCSEGCSGDDGGGDEGVGDAAMMFEAFDGARESPDDVEVGGFGGEDCSEGYVGGFAVKTGATYTCAG